MKNNNSSSCLSKNIIDQVLGQINSYENALSKEPKIFLAPKNSNTEQEYSYADQLETLNESNSGLWSKIEVLNSLKSPYRILVNTEKNESKNQKLNMYEIIQKSVESIDNTDITSYMNE